MQKIVKIIIFSVILLVLWLEVFDVLHVTKNSTYDFFKEPKDTMDVVYIGPSTTYVYFNSPLAFEQYGITVGLLSAGNQPVALIENLLKEVPKYQKPKLYVIDIVQFGNGLDIYSEGDIRNSVDNMDLSLNRIDAINNIFKYTNVEKFDSTTTAGNDPTNYYFRFLKYHNSWKTITKANFLGDETLYKQFLLEIVTTKINPLKEFKWYDEKKELPTKEKEVLLNLLNYIKENKLNVLFVIPNKDYSEVEGMVEQLNTTSQIIEENGFEVMNFNTLEDFKIDYSHDFHNRGHINTYGAIKYTLYFGKYLKEKYKLTDHRLDDGYASYHEAYQRYKDDYQKLTSKNYDDVLKEYIPLYQ